MSLDTLVSRIKPLDEDAMEYARRRQLVLTKPRGSLGRLELLSIQIAGITGQNAPKLNKKLVLVMAGDHGVVAEGVSAYPQDVTAQMVVNILNGGAAISVLARQNSTRIVVVDMGVKADLKPTDNLIIKKIDRGTGNIARGPAMSRKQAEDAIMIGEEIINHEIEIGMDIFATGEMGIGNTTPSAAIAMLLTGKPAGQIVGRGTGVSDSGLQKKVAAIRNAIHINRPNPKDGLDILSKIGGFEIAGLTGAILGAAANRKPIVIDGFISTAAAMVAVVISPDIRNYLIPAHKSAEVGHDIMLDWLKITPLLNLGLRLGEGTGAVLAFPIIDAACNTLNEMASFDEAGVSKKSENGS